jgi:hypothetical protein
VTSLDSPLPTLADTSEQLRAGRLSAVELTEDGMPFGLQIFGRPFSEPLLLRVGTAVQRLA